MELNWPVSRSCKNWYVRLGKVNFGWLIHSDALQLRGHADNMVDIMHEGHKRDLILLPEHPE